jgi:hypothetical protein
MKLINFVTLLILFMCFSGCNSAANQNAEQSAEFVEVRIKRWTALEGGEILVLRKINNDWSAVLLGDGDRFSCSYQKSVQPRSGWAVLWTSLKQEGLFDIPEGNYTTNCCEDGNGFDAEVFYQGKLKGFSFFLPEKQDNKEAKQIQNIGDVLSREFDTPMFRADYDRSNVGEYLINNCKNLRETDKN